jgi:short-subunit dehydrogenase
MAARMNEVLVIGGTAGIGEQIARRLHSLGKKVIVTGRDEAKLNRLKQKLKGLETSKVCHAPHFFICSLRYAERIVLATNRKSCRGDLLTGARAI